MKLLWLFSLLLISSLCAKPTLCLNMIVKNENHVITRCLSSVKPFIDYWIIVDTGSSDGTQETIKEVLHDIPGELYEKPWVNFGYNRSEALNLAKEKCDYLIFIDADDWLEISHGNTLPYLTKDVYTATWLSSNFRGFSYTKPLIVKSSLPWRWEGVIHEYLVCEHYNSLIKTPLNGFTYIIGGDGARSLDPNKTLISAQILEKALIDEPLNTRYLFYLAESYRESSLIEKALNAHQQYIKVGSFDEEIFWSYFQIAQMKSISNFPLSEVIESFYKAHHFRPHRPEPIYYLAEIFNKNRQYPLAYELIKGFQSLPKPKHKDSLFYLNWTEDYGLLFQLSIAAHYVENYEEALHLDLKLLQMEIVPDYIKAQIQINKLFSLFAFTNSISNS